MYIFKKISILIFCFLLSFSYANAEILFQTDFEDVQDWTAERGSKGFPNTWNQNPNRAYDPPKKNDGSWLHPNAWFRASRSTLAVSQGPMATIGAGQGRDNSRGLTYNFESCYGDSVGWAGGSPMTMYFGDAGYHEVWTTMWVKYPADMDWWDGVAGSPHTGIIKAYYISRLNEPLSVTTWADEHQDSGRPIHPSWLPQMYTYYSGPTYFIQYSNRSQYSQNNSATTFAYDHDVDDWDVPTGYAYYPTPLPSYLNKQPQNTTRYAYALPSSNPAVPTIRSDGQWHKYTYHVKMNSAPGVADGIQEVKLDDVRVFYKTNMTFVLEGVDSGKGWNYIELMDNHHMAAYDYTENRSFPVQIDDVTISTHDVNAAADPIAPSSPANLMVN